MKTKLSILVLTLVLLLNTDAAHALTPNYGSTFTPTNATTLSAIEFTTLSFAPRPGSFTNAILDLGITGLTNSVRNIGKFTLTSPPSGELFTSSGVYLGTTDLKLGSNSLILTPYLSNLNLDKSNGGINLGLYMDSGGVTYNKASLTGTVAPKPAGIALVCASLVALPFARRLRKAISAQS